MAKVPLRTGKLLALAMDFHFNCDMKNASQSIIGRNRMVGYSGLETTSTRLGQLHVGLELIKT
jgi:hypothetical protein